MKVVLEKPLTWLHDKKDGERNRLMYANVLAALHSLDIELVETDTCYGNDFRERAAPDDGLLISYHSVGNAPNVWRMKETPVPFFYNLDSRGYSGWSELSIEPEAHATHVAARDARQAEDYCRELSAWLVRDNLSKYAQADKASPLPGGFVLFPLQVRTDAVAVHNRIDPLDVLRAAARICRAQGKTLLVKRHPHCRSRRVGYRLRRECAFNRHLRLTDASITSLLPACDAVLVGNSGVGLEALVYGKPVYSFAGSEYELATWRIETPADIEAAFAPTPTRHPDAYKFAHYFFGERSFDARDPADVRRKLERLIAQRRAVH